MLQREEVGIVASVVSMNNEGLLLPEIFPKLRFGNRRNQGREREILCEAAGHRRMHGRYWAARPVSNPVLVTSRACVLARVHTYAGPSNERGPTPLNVRLRVAHAFM